MAVSELGAFLQRKREELGLSLEEIERRTHIRYRYLEAIEAGEWGVLPPGVYTRGLVKSYARALGISANSILRMYASERPSEARLPEPQLISQPLVREPRISVEMMLATAGFAIAAVLFAWLVRTEFAPLLEESRGRIASGAEAASGLPTPAPTAGRVVASATKTPVSGATAATTSTTGSLTPLAPRPSPTATRTRGLLVEVNATGQVWMRVVADGKEAFTGFLQPGDTDRWSAQRALSVKTGNAGGTQVKLNGKSLGSIGDPGQVVTCQWDLQPDGKIVQSGC